MAHKFLLMYSWLIRSVCFFFPDIPLFMRLRGFLYCVGMKKCGKNFQVTHNSNIKCLENIEIGDDVYLANNVLIIATDTLQISAEVMIGPNVVIVNGNHALDKGSYRYKSGKSSQITIGYGAWVSANSVIVSGGGLPDSSLLAANSVLNERFHEKRCILGGSPARIIGKAE